MKPEDCPKLDSCPKVKSILSRDMLEAQVVEAIRQVCSECKQIEK